MSPLRRLDFLALIVAVASACLVLLPAAARAAPCDPPLASAVACENSQPGTPESVWGVNGAGDRSIQGFATQMSVDRGQRVDFKIDAATASFHIDVYRLGYYGGDGARRVAAGLTPTGSTNQPSCLTDGSTGLIDCGNWSVSAGWTVPSTAVSGVYIARLTRDDTGGASHITFVVRDDGGRSAVLVQTSDATWQAYNTYGGNSLYQCTVSCPPGNPLAYKAAYKVSYNRPMHGAEDDDGGRSFLWWSEYPMIRFLEANGYDVSYTSEQDVQAGTAGLANHRVLVSSGHDEYWSRTQRANVEAARDAGVSLAFFSGNEIFWKTRNEASIASGGGTGRTLVAYKDTHFNQQIDPVEWTGTWRDPRYTTPPDRPTPENALTGQSFVVNSGSASITVPAEYGRLRLWRGTTAATLGAGQSLQLAPQTLGYEWDADADNGFRPAGAFELSSTTVSGVENFTDYGSTTATGSTSTHNMTLYRAPSGAFVFGAGTVQWSWGLDSANPIGNAPDRDMQQATVNLLADMGAQPATLLPGLVTASPSTDTARPTSAIAAPAGGSVDDGAEITISGTASDSGGGVVAGVEVSTDGGATWHPASGTSAWSYTWIAHGAPSTTIRARAVDDSGNLETPGAGVSVAVTCPCSLWGAGEAPPDPDSGDPGAIEVGVKFTADVGGLITGVRYYKAAANTGTHTGSLWSADGTLLARATFASETATGWQTATFATPVAIQGGATYVASYHAPAGHYANTDDYLYAAPAPGPNGGATTDARPLHALHDSGATRNGVYAYGATSVFPTNSFSAANYWVSPVFEPPPGPPGAPANVTARPATRSALVSWDAPSGPVTGFTVTPYIGAAAQAPVAVAAPATSTVVRGLANGTGYTFTVTATNGSGTGPASAPSGRVVAASTILDFATPAVADAGDDRGIEVGITWTADVSGLVTGVRFYKAAANTGTHTGSLWTAEGARLAQATFSGETASGWQSVLFATPVAVRAGTTYVASSFAPAGHYSETPGAFATAIDNPPLHALASAVSANGVYTYTGTGAFPSSSFDASDYGVDVLFLAGDTVTGGTGGTGQGTGVTGVGGGGTPVTPGAGGTGGGVPGGGAAPPAPTHVLARPATRQALVSWAAPAGAGITGFTITPFIGTAAQAAVSVPADARSTTVAGLQNGTPYRFVVTASGASGPSPPSAATAAVTPRDTLFDFTRPPRADAGDRNAVELGVKLRVDRPGAITGIRFYKGAANTGTHVGSLWTASGVRLARITFTGESADGWQTATFAAPVPVTPGRTYVASYFAPRGHYAATRRAFAAAGHDHPPLHAPPTATSSDGIYAYGPASRFPNATFDATGFWVDALFAPTATRRRTSPQGRRATRSHPTAGAPARRSRLSSRGG